MTSTNFKIGLGDAARPSSRVLRPPGGGHTNIFGAVDPDPVKKDMGRNASSILEGTNSTKETPTSPTKVTATSRTNNETIVNQSAPSQAQRSKVPPGGFSSGLW